MRAIGSLIYTVFVLTITGITLWGIGWSFYRHGTAHGVAAAFIPPYGFYRGVASLWDQPIWSENYDAYTRKIAIIIGQSTNTDPNYRIAAEPYRQEIKVWLSKLPMAERERLQLAADAYADATLGLGLIMAAKLADDSPLIDEEVDTNPEIAHLVAKFNDISGFSKEWELIKNQGIENLGKLQAMLFIMGNEGNLDSDNLQFMEIALQETFRAQEKAKAEISYLFSD